MADSLAGAFESQELHIDDVAHGLVPRIARATDGAVERRCLRISQFPKRVPRGLPIGVERRYVDHHFSAKALKFLCVGVEDGRVSFRRIETAELLSPLDDHVMV